MQWQCGPSTRAPKHLSAHALPHSRSLRPKQQCTQRTNCKAPRQPKGRPHIHSNATSRRVSTRTLKYLGARWPRQHSTQAHKDASIQASQRSAAKEHRHSSTLVHWHPGNANAQAAKNQASPATNRKRPKTQTSIPVVSFSRIWPTA